MSWEKILLVIILIFFTLLYLHNCFFYPIKTGYDAGMHYKYVKTLLEEKRIPLYEDTPESYNPPLYYFLSGIFVQPFLKYYNYDLFAALKSWTIFVALLVPLAGYLWFDLFKILNPQNQKIGYLFLIWLLSLPVLNKMIPMYNYEVFQFILASFTVWFFIKFFLKNPHLKYIFPLSLLSGLLLLTRIMSALLLMAMGLTIFLLWFFKKISFKKMFIFNLIFTLTTLFIGGWFYFFYKDYGVFESGEKTNQKIPLLQRQPKSFYFETFFRTSMKTPIRPNFPNRFIPIFYSDFWGDYWNFYRHRRYPLNEEEKSKFTNYKYEISKERLSLLAWQNRINFIPSLILIVALLINIFKTLKHSLNKKANYYQISEIFLVIFFVLSFFGFFYTNLKFPDPGKGDTIKPSYILFAMPVLFYLATYFINQIKKYKLFYFSAILIILISILFNLHFAWY